MSGIGYMRDKAAKAKARAAAIKPGLYPDMPEDEYRSHHDWLSVSGAKKLLPPSCPAKFKASIGVEEHKPQYDVGKAFHSLVLDDGPEVVVYDGDSWRSADARQFRTTAYADRKVPLLRAEFAEVQAMAEAVRSHETASMLFRGGRAEVSAFWVDEATGVQCKARFDYLPDKQEGRRLIVPDLKSAVSADPGEFARSAARFGYLFQQIHYSSALRHLGIDDDPAFLFVVCEKDAPYLTNVGQFADENDVRLSAAALDKALRLYRECVATDTWPGWTGVTQLNLPTWATYALEEMTA